MGAVGTTVGRRSPEVPPAAASIAMAGLHRRHGLSRGSLFRVNLPLLSPFVELIFERPRWEVFFDLGSIRDRKRRQRKTVFFFEESRTEDNRGEEDLRNGMNEMAGRTAPFIAFRESRRAPEAEAHACQAPGLLFDWILCQKSDLAPFQIGTPTGVRLGMGRTPLRGLGSTLAQFWQF
ncbi:hypothetical protein DM860_017827 [Cuscuta australis]|uniref:Uncharacterized protein n=1 Tax=Cuscuta australis TaxID=267555 RepID=A0A328DYF0_9ASTE|nr:hypothetical protein DM860_017827 [Cuscuta australis]